MARHVEKKLSLLRSIDQAGDHFELALMHPLTVGSQSWIIDLHFWMTLLLFTVSE